jgi:hypothetical protein
MAQMERGTKRSMELFDMPIQQGWYSAPAGEPARGGAVVVQIRDRWRLTMSDYRNPNPNDPLPGYSRFDPDARSANAAWGWIAGAVFLVVLLALAFGIGHQPNQGDTDRMANNVPPPAASHRASPPSGPASPTFAPAPMNPAAPPAQP